MKKLFTILLVLFSVVCSAQTWSILRAPDYSLLGRSNSLGYTIVTYDSSGYARVAHLSVAYLLSNGSGGGSGPALTYTPSRFYNAYGNFAPFSWDSLLNRPTIPTQTSQLTNNSGFLTAIDTLNIAQFYLKVRAGLAAVAVTGNYNSLSNLPTIPTQTSQLTNNSGFLSSVDTTNISAFYTKVRASLQPVAWTGKYSDLTGLPTIPTQTSQLTNNSGFLTSIDTTNISQFFLKVRAGLSLVATTGSYNDLLNRPTIPTNNNTLTNGAGYYAPADTVATISTIPNRNKLSDTLKATLVPKIRQVTINGNTQDMSIDRTWNVGTLTLADSATFSTIANRNKYSDSAKAVYNYSLNNLSIGGLNQSFGGQGTQRTWSIGVSLPGVVATITAASAAINTTETKLFNNVNIGANAFVVGATFRITLYGTCTSTVANLSTFTVRIGTAGSVADASVDVLTCTAAASGTTNGFNVELWVTVRTITATGTAGGQGKLINNGVIGISNSATVVPAPTTPVTVNSTLANILTVWYKSAAATTTSTFQYGTIEFIKVL